MTSRDMPGPKEDRVSGPDPPTPMQSNKAIALRSITGSDPLENHKAIRPAFKAVPSSARQGNAI